MIHTGWIHSSFIFLDLSRSIVIFVIVKNIDHNLAEFMDKYHYYLNEVLISVLISSDIVSLQVILPQWELCHTRQTLTGKKGKQLAQKQVTNSLRGLKLTKCHK